MGSAQKALAVSGFERGCPLATVALESAPDDIATRETLQQAGIEAIRAHSLAALTVSAYEGALVRSRVAGNVDAMQATSQALMDLVRMSLPTDQPTR